jgi:uncharacterized protein YlaI
MDNNAEFWDEIYKDADSWDETASLCKDCGHRLKQSMTALFSYGSIHAFYCPGCNRQFGHKAVAWPLRPFLATL